MKERFCGGGCFQDLNEMDEDEIHPDLPAMCLDCGDRFQEMEAVDNGTCCSRPEDCDCRERLAR